MAIDPTAHSLVDRLRHELYGSRRYRNALLLGDEPVELLRRVNARRMTQPIDGDLLLKCLRLFGRYPDWYFDSQTLPCGLSHLVLDDENAPLDLLNQWSVTGGFRLRLVDAYERQATEASGVTDKYAGDEPCRADGHINDRGNIVDIFV